jgi:hypothetical protein
MKTEARGDLLMRVGSLTARHQQPVAYQEADGVRKQVPVRYRLLAENRIGFQLGAYDRNRPLVIDPVIKYSTYLGGSAGDEGEDIAVDTDGAAYVTGDTDSTNFPTQGPFQSDKPGTDAFVSKLNAAGTALLYSTYLGGLGSDFGLAIAVGSSKSAFVTGITDSRDFPTTVGAFDRSFGGPTTFDPDAFVTKLNATGNILTYSTFLGGTASEAGFGIALDGQEQAFVTGNTYSTNFPTAGAFQNAPGDVDPNVPDAFVTKLNAAGSGLVFSTYLGGNDYDEGDDIAVDSLGRAVVTGVTFATNFPTTATRFQGDQPNADAFVTQFTAAGNSLSYSTYLGGSDSESALGVGIGPQDKIFVTGGTKSTDFPVKGPFQNNKPGMDAYVAKLDADASGAASLLYSTYLGGSADDQGTDIAVDGAGGAYVTGWTQSSDFPTKSPVQAALNGSQDAFATRLNVPGNGAVWSTFLGGSLSDQGNGIAVDPKGSVSAQSGSAYLTGVTSSVNFPTVTPIMTDPGDNATDAFVTKLRATLILRPFPLFASAFSATSIRLAWDDKSDTETGFEIFRAVGTGDFAFLARVGENAQTFVDNGLTPGQTYRYMVRAFNDEGQSDFSNEASAKPGRRLTAKLQVTPGRLSFGTVRVGRTKLVRLKLKNIGSAPLFVIVDGVDAPFTLSGLPAEGFTLARGRSRTVSVRFTPTAAGTFRDSAIVRIIGPSPAMRAIPLSGKATGAPAPQ